MYNFYELREKHPRFVYQGFSLTENSLEFDFRMDEHFFRPRWEFSADFSDIDRGLLNELAFSLGMAELVSYWKCACSPIVEIRCGSLDEKQILFWKTLCFNGLAEFFYRNGIETSFEDFMAIEAASSSQKKFTVPDLSGALVPVGGGKDSVVTLEILKALSEDITPYIINARGATLGCVKAAQISDPSEDKAVCPKRTIDKHLLELNAEGYLNGHTPFSAVVAFSSLLFAVISRKKYIALSNESSSNETYVDGAEINHQYSKSTAFERDFREYCRYSFGEFGDIPEYFSLLRPLSEWQIAREFVKYPEYFGVFQSCNLGSKTNVWCCNCAKCLYVYILLAAFLDDETLVKIFGCNMLEKSELFTMLDGLMLDGEDKPFECVGTKDEVRLSLKMALDRRRDNTPVLLKRFEEKFPNYTPVRLDDYFDRENFVPEKFLSYLEKLINGYK